MDKTVLLGEVVYPALAHVLRDGELNELKLIEYIDESGDSFTKVEAIIVGEVFHAYLLDARTQTPTVTEVLARFTSDLADFVAESSFGWGERRE